MGAEEGKMGAEEGKMGAEEGKMGAEEAYRWAPTLTSGFFSSCLIV
jgi:hypothetical protein